MTNKQYFRIIRKWWERNSPFPLSRYIFEYNPLCGYEKGIYEFLYKGELYSCCMRADFDPEGRGRLKEDIADIREYLEKELVNDK